MAWIQLEDTLPDHPKTIACAAALKLDKDALIGKLCRLWTWALNEREDGFIAEADIDTVAEKMRWTKKPIELINCLCAVPISTTKVYRYGFLERVEGGYLIHDWDERVCMLREKREEKRSQDRIRQARYREKVRALPKQDITPESNDSHAPVTRDNSVTSHVNHAVTVPKPQEQQEEQDACTPAHERADDPPPIIDLGWKRVVDSYMSNIGMLPQGKSESLLLSFYDDLGADVLIAAIEHTNLCQPERPFPFLKKILDEWAMRGITTKEQAQAAILDHKRSVELGRCPRPMAQSPPEPRGERNLPWG